MQSPGLILNSIRNRSPGLMLAVAILSLSFSKELISQSPETATLRARVLHDNRPAVGVTVRAGTVGALTDASGIAVLSLSPGSHTIIASRIDLRIDSVSVELRAGTDTLITLHLDESHEEMEAITISSTRGDRRIEDEPLRIEALVREEIEEKMLMTPGDITMLLNETSGLRVQITSPSLGGASARIRGMKGRYTQILSDGLPLHGGQPGGLGLLQIPPMDLGQVEVIKGAASAIYGDQALAGVINLVSRRPTDEAEREILLNQTSRGGSDGILWLSQNINEQWGATFLGGLHSQDRKDIDRDGWTDIPSHRRFVARPRVFWNNGKGHSLFFTAGTTLETRSGGTLPGQTAPDGNPFDESLDTRRFDFGTTGKFLFDRLGLLGIRASVTEQRHEHVFGSANEDDRHLTSFTELTLTRPGPLGIWVLGTAFQGENYRLDQVPHFDFSHQTVSGFVQLDSDPTESLALSAGLRLDSHNEYGTALNPRLAILLRAPHGPLEGWTLRTSLAGGTFSPSPLNEHTEVTGLTRLRPFSNLKVERAQTASVDIAGDVLGFEVNLAGFTTTIRDPIRVTPILDAQYNLDLSNDSRPSYVHGMEFLARWRQDHFIVTGSYALTDATEFDLSGSGRIKAPLVPRHTAGIVAMYEVHDVGRAGLEVYYTGKQQLELNPYRSESKEYVIVGMLAERRIGRVRVFINAENIGDVRQTKYDPLVTPVRALSGRWTTDAWGDLSGRTINGGVRLSF